MQRTLFAAVGALVLTSLFACTATEDAPKFPSADTLCTGRATEECQVIVPCSITQEACESKRRSTCLNEISKFSQTSRPYRSDRAEDYLNKVHTAYDGKTSVPVATLAELDVAFQRVFQGRSGLGAACGSTFECDGDDLICSKNICAKKLEKTDFCANPGEFCGNGLYCKPGMGTSNCVTRVGEGAPCGEKGENAECKEDLACSNGSCVKKGGPGAVCASGADCVSNSVISIRSADRGRRLRTARSGASRSAALEAPAADHELVESSS